MKFCDCEPLSFMTFMLQGSGRMAGAVIHVVDDDHQVRASTSFLLRSAGYHAEVYADGTEFLSAARLEKGCVLLDVRMPGLSGLEVQQALQARGDTIPVIMLSGHGDVATAVQAIRRGALDFLEKPYSEANLLESVQRAVEADETERSRRRRTIEAKNRLALLSSRELETLQGLVAGLTNKEIAARLDLSPRTVEMHRAKLMDSLNAKSLSQLVRIGMEAELPALEIGGTPDG
jgi:two-component system response regulator FixJ